MSESSLLIDAHRVQKHICLHICHILHICESEWCVCFAFFHLLITLKRCSAYLTHENVFIGLGRTDACVGKKKSCEGKHFEVPGMMMR